MYMYKVMNSTRINTVIVIFIQVYYITHVFDKSIVKINVLTLLFFGIVLCSYPSIQWNEL